jgi:ring-1,2-phenylacetyl-CoA epoxidase subunit PaaE
MKHFFPVRIKDVHRETDKAISFEVEPLEGKEHFRFNAGQYLTFNVMVGGEELRRSYSLCSSPMQGILRVAIKEIPGGKVSGYFNKEVKEGMTLQCMPPDGNFTLEMVSAEKPVHLVFFAAGSGITPIISMIRESIERLPNARITLFYGNTSAETTIFRDELNGLTLNPRFQLVNILSDGSLGVPLFSGRITFGKTLELIYNYCSEKVDRHFFVCGPAAMMETVISALEDSGIGREIIHAEYFSAPQTETVQQEAEQQNKVETSAKGSGVSEIEIILDGRKHIITLDSTGQSILDAALDKGLDAPFSCKGGVCTSCRAQVSEGEVRMDRNFALTDREIQKGFVLTCQAHPISACVKLSYDV